MVETAAAISVTVELPDEAATGRLADDLAAILRIGDVIALEGDLGAGKSTFARALLRAVVDDDGLEVPSPTFTLVQSYDFAHLSIAHFDLYRLAGADDLDEIGFDEAIRDGAALIEWPDRAEDRLPGNALHLSLDPGPHPGARVARLTATADWSGRLRRTLDIRAFLDRAGWGEARRRYLKSDASVRSLERVHLGSVSRVLMDHPAESDDEAARARKASRAAAKQAEDTRPFAAMAMALAERGFSAPAIFAHDASLGLVLMEDFGGDFIAEAGTPIAERYRTAIEVLAELHALALPAAIPDGLGGLYRLPGYDRDDLIAQLDPFPDWAMPHLVGRAATAEERTSFRAAWAPLIADALAGGLTWALRDYHSPNLMWLPDRVEVRRVGLLDFQDAVWLPPAYDVASLAQDARVTIPPELEADLIEHYIALRTAADARFETARFRRTYAVIAAQRSSRILGVFARLAHRDGRPGYLQHMPRSLDYLARALSAPGLADLADWYRRHLGAALPSVP